MFGNFFKDIIIYRGHFFQQSIISQPVASKTMIKADNDGMRTKFFDQEVLNVILGGLVCKTLGKWNNGEVVNTCLFKQFNFFMEGVDQPDAKDRGRDNFSRVRMKGDNNGFAIYFFSLLF